MDIRQLLYFTEICRHRSFSKAADRLYISQQGISMAISRLESELSCKLFRREGKDLCLTEQGEFLLNRAEEILEQFRICEEYFNKERDARHMTKTISITVAYGAVAEFAGELVFGFGQKYPDAEPTVRECCDRECDEYVRNGAAELGFSAAPFDTKEFETVELFKSRFCLMVHKTHPLAREESVSAGILLDLPVIMPDERCKTHLVVTECCRRIGFLPTVQFKTGETITVHRLVNANKGVGISVESAAKDLAQPNVRVIPFEDPQMIWSAHLIKKRGATLSPIAKTFERYVIKQMCPSSEEKSPNTSI
ncbi:MAG: LysR family transcriptional regulator [Oscillospiraceae bacterium]|nr:LysR family transcriptional regulator [Oscillospiraceae bacterium]